MNLKKHIPNLLTLSNLFCGVFGILIFSDMIFKDIFLAIGHSFFFLCLIFDFLDGAVAKLLKVQSKLGVQLDSLADLVSFGIYPAFWLFHAFYYDPNRNEIVNDLYFLQKYGFYSIWGLIVLLIPIFGALRLAKFNLDDSQGNYFKGLPVPAAALLFLSLPYFMDFFHSVELRFSLVLVVFTLGMGWLMLSKIPILNLKFSSFAWQKNWVRYTFLIGCLILILLNFSWFDLTFYHLPFFIILWLILSSVLFRKKIIHG